MEAKEIEDIIREREERISELNEELLGAYNQEHAFGIQDTIKYIKTEISGLETELIKASSPLNTKRIADIKDLLQNRLEGNNAYRESLEVQLEGGYNEFKYAYIMSEFTQLDIERVRLEQQLSDLEAKPIREEESISSDFDIDPSLFLRTLSRRPNESDLLQRECSIEAGIMLAILIKSLEKGQITAKMFDVKKEAINYNLKMFDSKSVHEFSSKIQESVIFATP
ncbi:MAG: hypothetical protein P1U74_03200 [Legionellaceae bacterium]|nr:hypothetical protein [Legionellaceae bacterium]